MPQLLLYGMVPKNTGTWLFQPNMLPLRDLTIKKLGKGMFNTVTHVLKYNNTKKIYTITT